MWYIGMAAGENYGKLAGWLAMAIYNCTVNRKSLTTYRKVYGHLTPECYHGDR